MIPNVIKIKVINVDTKEPIPSIIVIIKLFAKQKNDYNFDFISNSEGIIEIEKPFLCNRIKSETNVFVMDYASSLDNCENKIEIFVKSGTEIDKIFQGMKKMKYLYNISDDDIDKFQKAINKKYEPISKVVHFEDENIKEVIIAIKEIKS